VREGLGKLFLLSFLDGGGEGELVSDLLCGICFMIRSKWDYVYLRMYHSFVIFVH
jgi:hypothetical protein